MKKNYGINIQRELEQKSKQDYIFGSSSKKCIAHIPHNLREQYLPLGEVQKGKEDMMDCATRGPNNDLEAKLNYLIRNNFLSHENKLWFAENGYITQDGVEISDAFTAINSGTTEDGNSMKEPLHSIHSQGFIPKRLLPYDPRMTFDEYHNEKRITKQMIRLGKEASERFTIRYERANVSQLDNLLEQDYIILAGYAWPKPINGEYPKSNLPHNHVFLGLKLPRTSIFDNYIDSVDGDFIKKLKEDYSFFDYGYRLYIESEQVPKKQFFFSKWFNNKIYDISRFIPNIQKNPCAV